MIFIKKLQVNDITKKRAFITNSKPFVENTLFLTYLR